MESVEFNQRVIHIAHTKSSSTVMALYIPGELTDKIIGFVEHEDTLRACALVSRNWLPASRHMLFRNIRAFSDEAYRGLVRNVLRSARMQQCLGSTVTLHIRDSDDKPHPRYRGIHTETGIDPSKLRPPDSHSRSFLCDFAGNLPNLEELILFGCRWDTHLPLPSEPLLASRFPSVTTLEVVQCSLPSFKFLRRALASFPRLRSLSMTSVTYPPDTSSIMHLPTGSQMLPKLDTLHLSVWFPPECGHGELVTWLSQTSSRSSLRILSYDAVLERLGNNHIIFLQQVAPNITNLSVHIRVMAWPEEELRLFPMAYFTILRTLKVTLSIRPAWTDLFLLLREVRSRYLQILRLDDIYTVDAFASAKLANPDSYLCIDDDSSKELDTVLENRDFFKNLAHVYIHVCAMPAQIEPVQKEELIAGIYARLPKLAARGILSLQFYESPWHNFKLKALEAPSS